MGGGTAFSRKIVFAGKSIWGVSALPLSHAVSMLGKAPRPPRQGKALPRLALPHANKDAPPHPQAGLAGHCIRPPAGQLAGSDSAGGVPDPLRFTAVHGGSRRGIIKRNT